MCEKTLVFGDVVKEITKLLSLGLDSCISDVVRQPHPNGGWTGAVLQGSAGIPELSTWQDPVQPGIDGNPEETISAAEISFRA